MIANTGMEFTFTIDFIDKNSAPSHKTVTVIKRTMLSYINIFKYKKFTKTDHSVFVNFLSFIELIYTLNLNSITSPSCTT